MQNSNGEEGAAVADEDLQDGPMADNDARVMEVDDDMAVAETKLYYETVPDPSQTPRSTRGRLVHR